MRLLLSLFVMVLAAVSCGSSPSAEPPAPAPTVAPTTAPSRTPAAGEFEPGPGGYGFDRSDPEGGVANIVAAFATDEATATCVFDAWGDVANLPPEELTPELMTFEVCGTSIFQMMTGDARFTTD